MSNCEVAKVSDKCMFCKKVLGMGTHYRDDKGYMHAACHTVVELIRNNPELVKEALNG